MNLSKLQHWVQASAISLGGLGIFLVAVLDSSFLTFPVINDFLVIDLSIQNPSRMPYYALMATLGSLTGCLVLFYIAEKGGEAYFHRHAGHRAERIRAWMKHNGFLSVLIAALLPPPTPFKLFVIAAGVFEVRRRSFVLALLIARSVRYFGVGFLAVRYGEPARRYLAENKLELALLLLLVVLASYLLARLFASRPHPKS